MAPPAGETTEALAVLQTQAEGISRVLPRLGPSGLRELVENA